MKIFFCTVILFFSAHSFALPSHVIRIQTEVIHEGKRVTTSSIQVQPGQKGMVQSVKNKAAGKKDNYSLEVLPRNLGKNQNSPIRVDFHLSLKDSNDELVNQGKYLAKDGEQAIVSIDRGRTLLKMTAHRVIQ